MASADHILAERQRRCIPYRSIAASTYAWLAHARALVREGANQMQRLTHMGYGRMREGADPGLHELTVVNARE
eukprot:358690-Pleurochrysis_carterae.AAC.1